MQTHHLRFLAAVILTAALGIVLFQMNSKPTGSREQGIHPEGKHLVTEADSNPRWNPTGPVRDAVPSSTSKERSSMGGPSSLKTPGSRKFKTSTSIHRSSIPVISQRKNEILSARAELPEPELPRGIQLADDVQLPAAIMAKGDPATDSPQGKSPAAMAANEEIVNAFYRELAERLPHNETSDSQSRPEGETRIVNEGSVVKDARNRADLRFRTLYGDEAFNRQSMNSSMERSLAK